MRKKKQHSIIRNSPVINRRNFINKASIVGASFAAGYFTHTLLQNKGINVISGEEWRNDRQINPTDLKDLPSDEEILDRAKVNIYKYRKVDSVLKFIDNSGAPIAYQKIKFTQVGHQTDWGLSSAFTKAGLENPISYKKAALMIDLFNATTAKCYWEERWHQPIERYQGNRIYQLFQEEVEWGYENGLRVKGHPLVWTVEKAIPKWVFKYPYEQQLDFLKNHVQGLIEASDGKVSRWDLCNEMLWEPAFKNIALRHWPHIDPIEDIADYIAQSLEWARAIDPNAIYSLNDYGLVLTFVKELSAGDQRSRYLQLIEVLKTKNALPDAIGFQAHTGGKFPLGAFQRTMDDLAESKLPLQITEFWTKEKDFPATWPVEKTEAVMAEYIGNICTLAFAHPNVTHFTFWGNAQLFTEEGNPRKTYEVLYDLLKNKWSTNIQVETNPEGKLRFTGFKGRYQLQIGDQKVALDLFENTEKTIQIKN